MSGQSAALQDGRCERAVVSAPAPKGGRQSRWWGGVRLDGSDRRIVRLIAIVALYFVASVALQLHGSSLAVWKSVLHDEASPSGIVFSTPKSVRTDEWLAWTPAVLSQALHDPPFPVENVSVGAGKTPLLVNLPVRHYSMLFRPQLWGFFVFNVETAYAFYWNVKVCGLLLSFFFLLRALTLQFWLPLFGSGWLLFSAYTQWWFSCPPMLPEMLSCWALALLCVVHLFTTARRAVRIIATTGLIIACVNFTLCFYPPFQIPLVYLGLAVLAGWFWQNHRAHLQWRAGTMWCGFAAVAIATVVAAYVIECLPTLEIVSATKYPGARRSHGGELPVRDTFSGVLGFFNGSEHTFLATRGNSCESSNFYPLWLLLIAATAGGLWRTRRERRVETALLAVVAALTLYTFVPFPEWLCRITLLSYVPSVRAVLPIGVGGIMLGTMILANPAMPPMRNRLFVGFLAFAAVVMVLMASSPGTDPFLTPTMCGLLLAVNATLIALCLFAPRPVFCSAFLLCLMLNNGAVNPIVTGLGPLIDTPAGDVVREIKQRDPAARWVGYSTAGAAQFLKAQGVEVINGLNYVPDVPFYRKFDATGAGEMSYNRYAFAVYTLGDGDRSFHLVPPVTFGLSVAPTDPLLAARGVRYATFPQAVDHPAQHGLEFLARPAGNLWIYRIATAQ
jgi:hypothetical protein